MSHKWKIKSIFLKLGLLAGFVALVFVIVAIYKEINQKKQIQAQIDQLKAEADKISKNNSFMQDKIDYFASKDYAEVQSKDKLDMQNPGERVVVLQPDAVSKSDAKAIAPTDGPIGPRTDVAVANPLRWWNYFFKY